MDISGIYFPNLSHFSKTNIQGVLRVLQRDESGEEWVFGIGPGE